MLKLAIIGFSDGNGHPYSWSAICNGYDKNLIEKCGFPVIPRYLEQKTFPDDFLTDKIRVVSIWTQDISLSKKVAETCNIENVVANLVDIVKNVDGILLARDDAENHIEILKTIIPAGLPIYVDKPIALTTSDLSKVVSMSRYERQLFTCSALVFSKNLDIPNKYKAELNSNFSIYAESPKTWDKYSVHLIEPVLNIIPSDLILLRKQKIKDTSGRNELEVSFSRNINVRFVTTGKKSGEIFFQITTKKAQLVLKPNDTFECFKKALFQFYESIANETVMLDKSRLTKTVELIEAGR